MIQAAFSFGPRPKDAILTVALGQAWKYRDDFVEWLAANFHVWVRFEEEANKLWDRGRRHYSARTIGEVLRHESALEARLDGEWKLNNNRFPDLARLYMTLYPEREGFFELRDGQDRRAA